MKNTSVNSLMKEQPVLISPDATLQEAARKMKEADCGFLPVGNNQKPEGIITDRDIIIRAIADGKDPTKEKVRDYMTTEVHSCREGDSIEDAAGQMNKKKVGRLVVQDDDGKMRGVLTFGRLIRDNQDKEETSMVVEKATGKAA